MTNGSIPKDINTSAERAQYSNHCPLQTCQGPPIRLPFASAPIHCYCAAIAHSPPKKSKRIQAELEAVKEGKPFSPTKHRLRKVFEPLWPFSPRFILRRHRNIIIYGPQGSGKTTHAEALRQHYGMSHIVDDYIGGPLPDKTLALTSTWRDGAIPLEFALRAMQLSGQQERPNDQSMRSSVAHSQTD